MDINNEDKEVLLRVTQPDGTEHSVTINELCVTNNLTYQALVTLLVKKGVIEPQELLDEVNRVQKERFET